MATSEQSRAFDLLADQVQRWIWNQGWTELREAQEEAITPILSGDTDIIIAAATASGKTEAAFLPICSKLDRLRPKTASVAYISPLKALINDQFARMAQLCESLGIPVYAWHGDVSASKKKGFLRNPQGILLITPESLESLFVNHGHGIAHIFSRLSYIVVDELHSFIGTERGMQLQSLMHRLDVVLKRTPPRIGLSATIGDLTLAAEFLRPGHGSQVRMIEADSDGRELRLLIGGFLDKEPDPNQDAVQDLEDEDKNTNDISESIFGSLRGTSNLIFANSRRNVEGYADSLRNLCIRHHIPNEFLPHHGSLSKELRETAERAIKDKTKPVSIICTTTLELGIDIGSVESIAQIGPPPSVSSMCQRLGRSGRRGDPAILRVYISENEVMSKTPPPDALRSRLVQSVAMVRLLLRKWFEPPTIGSLHLSTMVQQLLSMIAQYGGVTPLQAWHSLCEIGPFYQLDQEMFMELLRSMGERDLIKQVGGDLLLHGRTGEKIVNHYSFYAAFKTDVEYRLVTGERTLGTLPIDRPISAGYFLIFGGRRWLVMEVDDRRKVVELKPAKGGIVPTFGGLGGVVHDEIRKEMHQVYMESDLPVFLNSAANELLLEGRKNFIRYQLAEKHVLECGGNAYLFLWKGDRICDTATAMLRARDLKAENTGIAIEVLETDSSTLWHHVKGIAKGTAPDAVELASAIENKAIEKYDWCLSDKLLDRNYASSRLDSNGAWQAIREIVALLGR